MDPSPLQGIRVVDLSRVFAMPYVGAYLADLGAQVIKIDTHHSAFVDTTRTLTGPYPDNVPGEDYWNRAGTFQTLNRGKLSLTLDLRAQQGMDVLLDIISLSDIVIENFTPRVTRRFGLDYFSLRKIRPDLVLVSNTGYGHSGPWSDFGAMASALEPTHGTGAFMGYLERDENGKTAASDTPNKIGNSYTDFLACWSVQSAVLAALYRRAFTGEGVWIDLAMYQTGVSFLGEGLLDFAFNGRRTSRMGNRHPTVSPHGCYLCLGKDRWVALSVSDDESWRRFCLALGQPELAEDPRFADPIDRHRNQDQLDIIIGSWTATQEQASVVALLHDRGVLAAPVLDASQLLADDHLEGRGFFESLEHGQGSDLGTRRYIGRGWKLTQSRVQVRGPAPDLGQDNESILGQLMGLTDQEIRLLEEADVIGDKLIPSGSPSVVPLSRQAELGWIAGYSSDY